MTNTPVDQFVQACESGKGWDGCKEFVLDESCAFKSQTTSVNPSLDGVSTIKDYTNWMAKIVENFGEKATFEIKHKLSSENVAIFNAVFGGFSDYVYVFELDSNGKIVAMQKIWNNAFAADVISKM